MDRTDESDAVIRAADKLYAARARTREARRLYDAALEESEAAARELNRLRNPPVPQMEFAPGA